MPSNPSTSSERSTNSFNSRVSFSAVEVRHYERCLSDNPSVQDGAPIGIGWEVEGKEQFSVDEFEGSREFERQPDVNLLMLPKTHRHELLLKAGYSQKEIAKSVRGVIKAKNQRRQTVNNLDKVPLEEFMENTKRGMKGVFCFGKNKENKMLMRESQKVHVANAAA